MSASLNQKFVCVTVIATVVVLCLVVRSEPVVSGLVTYDGMPLANASVFFVADSDGGENRGRYSGRSFFARTDSTGRYSLIQSANMVPGRYRVMVRGVTGNAGNPPEFADDGVQLEAMMAAASQHETRESCASTSVQLPDIYQSSERSILAVDVGSSGNDAADLKLFSVCRTAASHDRYPRR